MRVPIRKEDHQFGIATIGYVKYNDLLDYEQDGNMRNGGPGRHLGLTMRRDGTPVLIYGTQWQGEEDYAEEVTLNKAMAKVLEADRIELLEGRRFAAIRRRIECLIHRPLDHDMFRRGIDGWDDFSAYIARKWLNVSDRWGEPAFIGGEWSKPYREAMKHALRLARPCFKREDFEDMMDALGIDTAEERVAAEVAIRKLIGEANSIPGWRPWWVDWTPINQAWHECLALEMMRLTKKVLEERGMDE